MMLANLVPIGQPALGLGGLISQRKNRGNGGKKILMRQIPEVPDTGIHRFKYLQNGFTDYWREPLWAHW